MAGHIAGEPPGAAASSHRAKRLSVLLLLGLLAVDGVVQWTWWSDLGAAGEVLAQQEALETRLSRAVRDAAAAAPAAGEGEAKTGLYLAGETETIAAAAFQSTVLKLLEAQAATVLSVQVRLRDQAEREAGVPEPGLRRIDLEIAFEARMPDIQAILFRMETGAPVMVVTDLQIHPAAMVQDGAAPDAAPLLHVVVAVHAFWRA